MDHLCNLGLAAYDISLPLRIKRFKTIILHLYALLVMRHLDPRRRDKFHFKYGVYKQSVLEQSKQPENVATEKKIAEKKR